MIAQEFGCCPFKGIPALKEKLGNKLSPSFSKVKSILGQDIFNRMVYTTGQYEHVCDTLAVKVFCTTQILSVQVAHTIQRLFDIVCTTTMKPDTSILVFLQDKEGSASFDFNQDYGKFYVFGMEGYGVKVYSDDTSIFVDFYKA